MSDGKKGKGRSKEKKEEWGKGEWEKKKQVGGGGEEETGRVEKEEGRKGPRKQVRENINEREAKG